MSIDKAIENSAASVEMEGFRIDEQCKRLVPEIIKWGTLNGRIYCSR